MTAEAWMNDDRMKHC